MARRIRPSDPSRVASTQVSSSGVEPHVELRVEPQIERAAQEPIGVAPSAAAGDSTSARDLRVFNRMLRGEIPVEQGMLAVAHSGGWPIRTPQGFIFAHPAEGRAGLALAGDHNDWKPQVMAVDNGVFWARVPAERVQKYKLVNERAEFFADPWARSYNYDQHGEYSIAGARGSRFDRWPGMTDGVVAPRTVRVFVPAKKPTHHLYVQDGQTLFAPDAPHGGWKLHQSTGPRTLVIGIDATAARRDEYTHVRDVVKGVEVGGKADNYVRFVEETLRPFIEARYGSPRKTGVMGASLGGLCAFYQAMKYPDSWDFAGALSGSMKWGQIGAKNPTIADLFRDRPKTKTVFYLDSGNDNYESNRKTADAIAALGYQWDRDLFHWHEANAVHTEADWAKRVHHPLEIFERLK